MSRQLEQKREEKQIRRDKLLVHAVEFGLEESVEALGATLTGFTVRYGPADCLLVLKTRAGDSRQVSFVGAEDVASCLIKAVRQAKVDELVWRADKF